MRILVIEDVEADFLLVERAIRKHHPGAGCRRATDPASLEAALREGGWDAVISDHNIAGMPFEEGLAIVRRHAPGIPILLVSGSVGEERAVEILKLGVRDFVLKDRLARLGPAIELVLRDAAEQAARRRAETDRARLATAIDAADEVVIITDAAGTIQYVNPAFERRTGIPAAEALGAHERILRSGRHDDAFYAEIDSTLRAGRTWRGHITSRRRNGAWYEEEATVTPVRGAGGGITNVVAVRRDVTEEMSLADELRHARKLEALGTLAGGVAHDFNNLLQGILGFTEFLIDREGPPGEGDPERRELLLEIQSTGRRAADLTRQLLTFARKQTVAPERVDMNRAIEAMLPLLRRLAGGAVAIDWSPERTLWAVWIDPAQVDQMVMNLVVNARDAVGRAGRIAVATANRRLGGGDMPADAGADPGDYATLVVADDGCGMDESTIERIFEPFFTTKEAGHGTGLGLSTVYGIARQNRGFVTVTSAPGQGSVFTVHLPRFAAKDAPGDGAEAEAGKARGRGETVLVVDGEETVRAIGRRCLERLGYRVLTARTSDEAVARLGEGGAVHLLLADMAPPGMPGRELARRAAALRPGLKFLFMSGFAAEAGERGAAGGAEEPLRKPFTLDALSRRVRETLDGPVPADGGTDG